MLQGAATGVANAIGAKQVREASLTAAISDFDPLLKRTDELAERAQKLSDRLFGPQPSPIEDDAEKTPAASLIESINRRRYELSRCLDRLDHAIETMERVL